MIPIIVLGDTGDRRIVQTMENLLGERLWAAEGKRLSAGGPAPRYLAVCSQSLEEIAWPGAVLVLQGPPFPKRLNCRGCVAVVSSLNQEGLRLAERWGLPAVSCGLGGKDTLTFSSNTGEEAVLCLQRPLTTISGLPLEPREIPIRLSGRMDAAVVLLTAAALLLLGEEKLLEEGVFSQEKSARESGAF